MGTKWNAPLYTEAKLETYMRVMRKEGDATGFLKDPGIIISSSYDPE